MAFMKIHCENCGGSWEVYFRAFHDPKARECPHCFERIEQQTWERQIVPAFGAFSDANLELARDEADHHPRFTVDFVDDSLYANRYNKPRIVWRKTTK